MCDSAFFFLLVFEGNERGINVPEAGKKERKRKRTENRKERKENENENKESRGSRTVRLPSVLSKRDQEHLK